MLWNLYGTGTHIFTERRNPKKTLLKKENHRKIFRRFSYDRTILWIQMYPGNRGGVHLHLVGYIRWIPKSFKRIFLRAVSFTGVYCPLADTIVPSAATSTVTT